MGGRRQDYAYPAVHPPSTQPQYQHLQPFEQPSGNRNEGRFSWMGAPVEPSDGNLSPTSEKKPSTSQFPFPPDQLHNARSQANDQQYHEHTQQHEASHVQEPLRYQQQSMSQTQSLQHTKIASEAAEEAGPLPRKQPLEKLNTDKKMHIGPDQNPLSPNSPVLPSHVHSQVTSPNIAMSFAPMPSPARTSNIQSIQGGTWQHSLCSCAEPSICMTGIFCPCVIYGRTQYRLSLRSDHKDPTNMLGYKTVNGSCAAWAVLCGVNIFLSAIQHTRIRKSYEMSPEAGNVVSDCLKSVCCCCCMLTQDEKEVKYREETPRKPTAGDKVVGYVTPTAMTFNPPP